MPTARESILHALHVLLQTQPAPVLRGEVLSERVPASGMLILRDGDPGEPAVTLSPLRYHYQHRADVEAVVQTGTGCQPALKRDPLSASKRGSDSHSVQPCGHATPRSRALRRSSFARPYIWRLTSLSLVM